MQWKPRSVGWEKGGQGEELEWKARRRASGEAGRQKNIKEFILLRVICEEKGWLNCIDLFVE
ncbi:hypothetical protein DMA11_16670 [Marinilabiliaceae bacterium JC017]|nr:hypothetical protein DMA11_16670 [Marinilabiliaceae bacterium JC017]